MNTLQEILREWDLALEDDESRELRLETLDEGVLWKKAYEVYQKRNTHSGLKICVNPASITLYHEDTLEELMVKRTRHELKKHISMKKQYKG